MMYLGRMRHRLVIQHLESTRDGHGAPVETWTDVATVWGSIEALSGREFFASQQTHGVVSCKVRIRHRDDLRASTEWRLSHAGRILGIAAVLPANDRSAMTIMCREVDGGEES